MIETSETPQRIQRQRAAGWRMQAGAIYAGRPTVFGNPWKVKPDLTIEGPGMYFSTADEIDTAYGFAVQLYREWLWRGEECPALMLRRKDEMKADREQLEARRRSILGQLHTLTGHDLACWCPEGLACHSDVLLSAANQEAL